MEERRHTIQKLVHLLGAIENTRQSSLAKEGMLELIHIYKP